MAIDLWVSMCWVVGRRLLRLWNMLVRSSSSRLIFSWAPIGMALRPFSRKDSIVFQMSTRCTEIGLLSLEG